MKRLIAVLLSCLLIVSAFAVPALAESEAPVMEKVNVAWDLQAKKTFTSLGRLAGLDVDCPVEYTVTNLKDTVGKDGMRKISFTLTGAFKYAPKKDEIATIVGAQNADGRIGGAISWTLVDYDTGLDIEEKNDVSLTQDVKVKTDNKKKYSDNQGYAVTLHTKMVFNITITCPKDYDGLCFGVLGQVTLLKPDEDNAFWSGEAPFTETSFWSPDNDQVSHFMRFRAVE